MSEEKIKIYLKDKSDVHLSDDFDKDMMLQINKHALSKSKDNKYIRLMYLFFASGLLLGFIIAVSLVDLKFVIGSNRFVEYRIILVFPLVLILLFLFEKVYKATMVRIGKENFSSI